MTLHLQSQGNVIPQKRKAPSQEEKMQRAVEAWGVGTSSGISLGNLWIIPTDLMKVVRIRNTEIQGGQRWCEETQTVKSKPKENEGKGLKDEFLEDTNAAVPLRGIRDRLISFP